MAIDLKRSHASLRLGRNIATGTQVEQEGVLLCGVIEDGVEKVSLVAAPAGTEQVIGFAYHASALPTVTSEVEEVIPPATGTFELDLRHKDVATGQIRVVIMATNVALTIDPVYAGAAAAGTVKVDFAAGKLKFNSGVGKCKVTYLWNLTYAEALAKFGQRSINNNGLHAMFNFIEIGCGNGELYADQYDATVDWAAAAALYLGANGSIAGAGPGPVLNAHVVAVPSVDQPMLGIKFTI